jgi:ABC-type branched-subunit amino acid transport system permease subunit
MDWGAIIENTTRGLIGEQFIYFGLAALGLNIHFGYTGLLNLGQAVFMAAGAYGLSMSVVTLGLNFWWGLLLGIIVFPLILAAIMGVPTLRLRADYLAIVTIAASEMFRIIARSPSLDRWTGSSDGLTGFAATFYELSPYDRQERYLFGLFIGNQMWVVTVGWITLAIVLVISLRLMRSPWGRVLKAIREDEDAARSLGKNAYWYKMQALMIGGVFGAMGGMLRAIGTQSAQPQNFITDVTFFAWVALILGGAAKVLRTDRGRRDPLRDPLVHRCRPPSRSRQRTHPRVAHDRHSGRPGPVHAHRTRPDPAGCLPTAGHLWQQGGDGAR